MCNGNRINSSSFPEVKDDRIELDVNTDVDTESMLWLGIATSNSLTRKTTGLAPVTSSKLHRPKIINNNDMEGNKKISTSHFADLLRPES